MNNTLNLTSKQTPRYYSITNTLLLCTLIFFTTICRAKIIPSESEPRKLNTLPGFLRLSYDNNIRMPNNIANMGLLGFDYFADITPLIYAGFGGYGSVVGTQGGLFTVGVEGGMHYELIPKWSGDIGLFIGGGGGKSSLTGGGLMVRPHAGITYKLSHLGVGLLYSYIDFPNGEIHSQQLGVNLDLPMDFAYLSPNDSSIGSNMFDLSSIQVPINRFIDFDHNDFALFVQAYQPRAGTLNSLNEAQDKTMGLVGAELDHYFTNKAFWWIKTSGAFSGQTNGYMDVIGGLGYQLTLGQSNLTLVPQFGLGAGGGGLVETGGGFLINPLLGIEWDLSPKLSLRASSGYLWAVDGNFQAIPITGELIWHLDIAKESYHPKQWLNDTFSVLGWRFQLFNQTYFHPKRTFSNTTSEIQLMGIQIDQLITPWVFLSYQATGAYIGYHAGGYATGMIGPGIQSRFFYHKRLQLFSEVLIGAGGGGGLSLNGGSLIEPMVGIRYAFTQTIGVQASVGQLKALRADLNTTTAQIGLTMRFDTLNHKPQKNSCNQNQTTN